MGPAFVPDVIMPLRHNCIRLLAVALVLLSSAAQAKREDAARLDLPANATLTHLAQQREQIEVAIKDADAYGELRASDRKQMRASLDSIAGQIEAAGSLGELAEGDRKALMAQQDAVNSVLETAYGDSRIVCKREKEIGSNFRRSVCMSVAQRRRMSGQAQQFSQPQS